MIGGPAHLQREVIELAGEADVRMVAEQAIDDGRARARHADDEDRLRAFVHDVRRFEERGRRDLGQPLEQAARSGRIVGMARVHDRVRARERVPRLVVAAEILELLVARKLDRPVRFAPLRHRPDAPLEIIEVVAPGRLLAQARELERRARRCVRHAKAGIELGLRFLHAAIEDELHRRAKRNSAPSAPRLLARSSSLSASACSASLERNPRRAHERGDFARALERRMIQTLARGDGLTELDQRGDDVRDQELVVRQHLRRVERVARRVADAILLPGDAGEDQMHVDVLRRFLRERFERDARGGDLVFVEVTLGSLPEPVCTFGHEISAEIKGRLGQNCTLRAPAGAGRAGRHSAPRAPCRGAAARAPA